MQEGVTSRLQRERWAVMTQSQRALCSLEVFEPEDNGGLRSACCLDGGPGCLVQLQATESPQPDGPCVSRCLPGGSPSPFGRGATARVFDLCRSAGGLGGSGRVLRSGFQLCWCPAVLGNVRVCPARSL